ncbi:MAG: ubiquinol-cytochrome C chaperone family protein [Rhodospirillales bacterium]|nr:ubiquinol-cytochrome C chaperone family protein [Rhodospirillales bacterium]
MAVGRVWRHLKRRKRRREAARRLYTAAVRQARDPILYTEGGVADTLDGRFDLIVLHVVTLMRRLRQCEEAGRQMSQALFDVMFDDMDQSLREMGVGDLRVGKRVKQMARAFYGRAKAYDQAFEPAPGAERRRAIAEALERNVFNNEPPPAARVLEMAAYVETLLDALDRQSPVALLGGEGDLPPVPPLAAAPAAEGGQ